MNWYNKVIGNDKKKEKWVLAGIVFLLYICVSCFKLTHAALWFDETFEHYVSTLPFMEMYEKIAKTFQPPLYNWVLYVWLQICDTEWWFRFSGVVIGFGGACGLYATVNKLYGYRIASLSIVIFSCMYRYIYFVQECAEYILMLALLAWTMYFYIEVLREATTKKVILFTIFCILPIYSQYGATFLVVALAATVFLKMLLEKDWKNLKALVISYGTAGIVAGLPLLYFFVSKQIGNKGTSENAITFYHNVVIDFVYSIIQVVRWNLMPDSISILAKGFVIILIGAVVVGGIFCGIFSKKSYAKYMLLANIITYLLYYVAVKLNVYTISYKLGFGNRYNLFFIPIWIITIFFIFIESFKIIEEKGWLNSLLIEIGKGMVIFAVIFYCVVGIGNINIHWVKEDVRGAVDMWYEEGADTEVLVYHATIHSFDYYLHKNAAYTEELDEYVTKVTYMGGRSTDEYFQYYMDMYQGEVPEELYIVGSQCGADMDEIIATFEAHNYLVECLYDYIGAKLYRVTLIE